MPHSIPTTPRRVAGAGGRSAGPGGIDFRELDSEVTRRERRDYARVLRHTDPASVFSVRTMVLSVIATAVAVAIAAGVLALFAFVSAVALVPQSAGQEATTHRIVSGALVALLMLALAGVVVVVTVQAIRRDAHVSNHWARRLRQARFAEANAGVFVPEMSKPTLPGSLFGRGTFRRAEGVFDLRRRHGLMVGTLTATGRELLGTRRWTFVTLRLRTRVPHLVLEARRPRGTMGRRLFGWTYTSTQRLSLEGDFDRHFRLYVPAGYGADALYVFTPDLMSLLLDHARGFDVEMVDDHLVLSRPGRLRAGDAASLAGLVQVVTALRAKVERQTDRYSDERPGAVPHVVVAPAGRRLRRSRTVATVVAVLFVAWRAWSIVHGLSH